MFGILRNNEEKESVFAQLHPLLQDIAKRLGVKFVEPHDVGKYGWPEMAVTTAGFYDPSNDIISVKTNALSRRGMVLNNQDRFFMHELTHWVGGRSRLDRPVMRYANLAPFVCPSREELSTEEATAELGAMKLSQALNIDPEKAKENGEYYLAIFRPYANMNQAERDSNERVAWVLDQAFGANRRAA